MPKRPLAPLALEQWCTVAGFGVIVLAASGLAAQTDQPSFGVLDAALIAAVAVLMAWWLRRQRRDKIGVAPLVPPDARIDSRRRTIALAVAQGTWLLLLVSIAAYDAGPAMPILLVVVTSIFAWHAREVQRWERRTGSRAYRERIFFAREAPFFYRSS
jgi:ABC-type nickel/cobalt efflux system permease component RcnA